MTVPKRSGEKSIEQQKLDNLKRQIDLLETDNRRLREAAADAFGVEGGSRVGVQASMRRLNAEQRAAEGAHAVRENELEAKAEQLRKEALSAKLRESRAIDDLAEARQLLADVRVKAESGRQELTAEVVAYQRDLEKYYHIERALKADYDDVSSRLREREAFVEGFDTQVRLLKSQLDEKSAEIARCEDREAALRVELQEERVQHTALKDKAASHGHQLSQLEDQRARAAAQSQKAAAELRLCQMALEQETAARKLSDEAKAFMVGESAKLESAIKELTSSAEFVSAENARLKRDAESNKVMKVVSRFMVRKMREKLLREQEASRRMEERQEGLHVKLVKAQQKADAIDLELATDRRRQALREDAYDQQKRDASNLTVENRLLLERAEQMAAEASRTASRLKKLEEDNVQLTAERDVLREQADLARALRSFRPDELANLSDSNIKMAESIKALLPRLSASANAPPAAPRMAW